MILRIFSARWSALVGFAIIFTGLATFIFTERPSAQKFEEGDDTKGSPEQIAPETGTIQGNVYIDFNMNGTRNISGVLPDLAVDDGIAGVTVTAFAANGTSVTTTSTTNGSYSLNTSGIGVGPYRIEFTNLPSGYFPSYIGTNNGSTVRFIPDGNQSGVDLGILNATEEYCQNNPRVVVPRWRNGRTSDNTVSSLSTIGWGILSRTPDLSQRNWSSLQEMGTTWATAFKRTNRTLYTTAFLRRHAGLGPQGMGGVYIQNVPTDPTAAFTTAGSFTLQGVTPANGGASIDLGSVNRTDLAGDSSVAIAAGAAGDYQLAHPDQGNRDLDAFDKVGKTSFGDAEMEANMQYLWLVNLNQRALIRVDTNLTTPAAIAASARQFPVGSMTGVPTCPNGVFRPFAIKFHLGVGYLGGTCTAESGGTSADLSARILSFTPSANVTALTPVITVPLNYAREARESNSTPYASAWRPWADQWNEEGITFSGDTQSNTAPLLANIEFTQNGSIVLGIMDRVSAQAGNGNFEAISGSFTRYNKRSAGDINMICRIGAAYALEGAAGCTVQDNTPFASPGPGDGQIMADLDGLSAQGEFFWADNYYFGNNQGGHGEVTLGGLVTYPGSDQVVSTTYDPVVPIPGTDHFNTQGLMYFNETNGARIGYQPNSANKFDATNGAGYLMLVNPGEPDFEDFGKALGLGEPDLLCNSAPLQIGNRVWMDSDRDGVQDPGEAPIAGVTVHLYDSLGNVQTAITDANGEYLFSGVLPNTSYQIRFDNPANYSIGGALFGTSITTPNKTGQAGDDDSNDSDAVSPVGSYPTIFVTTGGPGQNNHTLDAGFVLAPTAARVDVTGRVLNANGSPIRNATVILTQMDGTRFRYVTGSFGYFIFTGIEAGQTVFVEASAGKRTFSVPTIVVNVGDNVSGVNFYADELR